MHLLAPAQAVSPGTELIAEVKRADTILACPSTTSARRARSRPGSIISSSPALWVNPETHAGLLGGRDLIVLAARGGGYGPGTPREGWDHAAAWLPHGLSYTGLEPRVFITAELALADVNPAMADLRGLAAESLSRRRA